jgi:hypothetical protein
VPFWRGSPLGPSLGDCKAAQCESHAWQERGWQQQQQELGRAGREGREGRGGEGREKGAEGKEGREGRGGEGGGRRGQVTVPGNDFFGEKFVNCRPFRSHHDPVKMDFVFFIPPPPFFEGNQAEFDVTVITAGMGASLWCSCSWMSSRWG